ncbi:ladderlectin-like, partial [Coregonus clupeaformis]|uniref:ladderlectin-like n=1 Tax=Coregonus clupeaformis TaxID=59861 RepID=UPI001E1C6C6A
MSLLLCCAVMALHLVKGVDAASGVVNTTDQEVVGVEPQSPCPAGWHQNGHRCFSFYPVWATWSTAESYCSLHRGNLVSVHSPGQQVFVQDLVRRHTDQPVWMGGYDAAQEGMWLWSDGSAVDHFYWEEDEPSNSGQGENCMELHTGELVEEVSIYDVLWETSKRVADETLYSAFLRGMYSRRLPARFYADFCHQEALYLDRVITMLQVLIRTVQGPPDIMLFLQTTHQHYQESLKEAQNQTPPHL